MPSAANDSPVKVLLFTLLEIVFGISTAARAGERAREFIEARGLEFRSFEAFGGKAERGTPLGGLIVAGVPGLPAAGQ